MNDHEMPDLPTREDGNILMSFEDYVRLFLEPIKVRVGEIRLLTGGDTLLITGLEDSTIKAIRLSHERGRAEEVHIPATDPSLHTSVSLENKVRAKSIARSIISSYREAKTQIELLEQWDAALSEFFNAEDTHSDN